MKKATFIFVLVLLSGVVAYTIYANVSREITVIKIPEGTITETMTEVEEVPASNPSANPNADSVIVVETIEVPEGIITVRTEMIGPQLQSESGQTDENSSADSSERIEDMRNRLLVMMQRVRQLKQEQD